MLHIAPWKIVFAAIVVLASILWSLPNVIPRSTLDTWPSWVPTKQANLGLDLQGGAHLLLEVDVAAVTKERLEGLLDDPQRVVPGQDDRAGDQLDPAGFRRHPAEHSERIGTGGIIGEMMLDRPDPIEPHRLGLDRELRLLPEELRIGHAVQVLIAQMQPDLHRP